MATFNKDILLDDLNIAAQGFKLHSQEPKELKKYLSDYYKATSMSTTNRYKLVNELVHIFEAEDNEATKKELLNKAMDVLETDENVVLPPATYVQLLRLTFPLLDRLYSVVSSFGETPFTAAIIMPTMAPADRTVMYRAIRTFCNVGLLKKIGTGVFQYQQEAD